MFYQQNDKWYFPTQAAYETPSYKLGLSIEKETFYRQNCASLIQDMGQQLKINQTAINTAIVFMHRFYCFQTFQNFHRNDMAVTCLLLASKVEEQIRFPVDIYIVFHCFIYKEDKVKEIFRSKSHPEAERFNQKIISYEKALFMTLNSEILITHANEFVLICSIEHNYPSDVTQTAYFLATNSLHLTRFCVMYPPEFVACVSLYLAGEWASFQLQTNEDPNAPLWFECISPSTQFIDIKTCALDFLDIMEKCPSRIKRFLRAGPILSNINDITLSSKTSIQRETAETTEGSINNNKSEKETNKQVDLNIFAKSSITNDELQSQTEPVAQNVETEVPSVCYRLQKAWDAMNILNVDKNSHSKSYSDSSLATDESLLFPQKRSRRSLSFDANSSQQTINEGTSSELLKLNHNLDMKMLKTQSPSKSKFELSPNDNSKEEISDEMIEIVSDPISEERDEVTQNYSTQDELIKKENQASHIAAQYKTISLINSNAKEVGAISSNEGFVSNTITTSAVVGTDNEEWFPISDDNDENDVKLIHSDNVKSPIDDIDKVNSPVDGIDQVNSPVDDIDRVNSPVDDIDQIKSPVDDIDQVKTPIEEKDKVKSPVDDNDQVKSPVDDNDQVKSPVDEKEKVDCKLSPQPHLNTIIPTNITADDEDVTTTTSGSHNSELLLTENNMKSNQNHSEIHIEQSQSNYLSEGECEDSDNAPGINEYPDS